MSGKKSSCPECGEKLRVPNMSEKIAPVEINPRLHDVYDLIESINSLEFSKESLIVLVQKYNDLVDTVKLKNMQAEARENLSMKLQAELWEHEAARCEMADNVNDMKKESRALKEQLAQALQPEELPDAFRKVQQAKGPDQGMVLHGAANVEHGELERLENINRAQGDQIDALTMQLEAQQHELHQLRLSQVESQEKRERLCEEISRLNRIISDLSSRLQDGDKITKIAIA